VIIARESANVQKQTKFDPEYVLQGGKAVFFDSSLVARIQRDGWIEQNKTKDKPGRVVGESHRVRVYKTKVSALEGRATDCWFHTSNGAVSPEGFDLARDAFELGVRLKIINANGSSFSFRGHRIGIGEHQAVKAISEDADLLSDLQEKFVLGDGEEPAEAEQAAALVDAAEEAVQPQVAPHQRSKK
jgi:hypothetical protein